MPGGCVGESKEGFPRRERLHLKREVEGVFAHGKKSFCFPYRVVFRISQTARGEGGVAIAVVAPKRLYKRAVVRNRQKRRLRELYRTQAGALRSYTQQHDLRIAIMLLCVSKEECPREKAQSAVKRLLGDVLTEAQTHTERNGKDS